MGEEMVVCSSCASVNRLGAARPALFAKCGKCGRKIFVGHPPDVDAATLRRHLARTTLPVLVDVWAPWCGPCKMMAPAYEAAAKQLEPDVVLIKLNSDDAQSTLNGFLLIGWSMAYLVAAGIRIGPFRPGEHF